MKYFVVVVVSVIVAVVIEITTTTSPVKSAHKEAGVLLRNLFAIRSLSDYIEPNFFMYTQFKECTFSQEHIYKDKS